LHAVDYAAPGITSANPKFGVNWWSDGGICSNLPVHFFDSPLPSRPTFAVDLAQVGQVKDEDCENSYLPVYNGGGTRRRWTTWGTSGIGATAAFGKSIVDSARSWVDEAHLTMPGYRDRIVTIFHDKREGGMNLTMAPETVERLAARGRYAAGKLVERFAGPAPGIEPADGWENQRWIRLRTAGAGLEEWLAGFGHGYAATSPGATTYAEFAGTPGNAAMPAYPVPSRRRLVVNDRITHLLALADGWAGDPPDAFGDGAPQPRPRLRLVPDDGVSDSDPGTSTS
jgi:hypothetical protein